MSMKRLAIVFAPMFAALVLATAALAGTSTYAGPRYWMANETGGSAYSSSWWRNAFSKQSSGYDTTVTFIDNVGYGWHNTVRNSSLVTYTTWFSSQVKRGHCKANQGYFNGSCWVVN